MATYQAQAVPLCYPDNHTWGANSQTLSNNDSPPTKLLLCEDGIAILKEIDIPVVVVCITGPASSGKSYLLSQVQNGGDFPVHHKRSSSTSGIWITVAPQRVLKDGREARIVFLDTEGLQSLYDGVTNDGTTWEKKLFLLSFLLSSFFIFNNPGTPSSGDLRRLRVLTSFGNILLPQKQRRPRGPPGDASTDLFWLIRDESRRPKLRGKPCNWATFLRATLLQRSENNQDCEREMTRVALIRAFGRVDGFAMPLPSNDSDVMRKLDSPEMQQSDLNPAFIRSMQLATNKVIASARVKTIAGTPISGKRLAVLLSGYVDALNKEGGKINVESSLACTMALESAEALYSSSMRAVPNEMPCSEQKMRSRHVDAMEKASKHFMLETSQVNPSVVEFYKGSLSSELESTLQSHLSNDQELRPIPQQNEESGVSSRHLQHSTDDLPNSASGDAMSAREPDTSANTQQAGDPAPASHCEEGSASSGAMRHVGAIQAQELIQLSVTSYQRVMLELQLPCETPVFVAKHGDAVSEAKQVFSRRSVGAEEERSRYHNELMDIIQNERSSFFENNCCLSVEACEELTENLKKNHLASLEGELGYNYGYDALLEAVEKLFKEYDARATGPKKEYVKSQTKERMDVMLSKSHGEVIELGVRKADEWFKKISGNLQLPATDEALRSNIRSCRESALNRFHYYTRGTRSDVQEKELSKVLSHLEELSSLRKLENEKSRAAMLARQTQRSQRKTVESNEDPKPLATAAVVGGAAVAVGLVAFGLSKLFGKDEKGDREQHRSRQNNRRY